MAAELIAKCAVQCESEVLNVLFTNQNVSQGEHFIVTM